MSSPIPTSPKLAATPAAVPALEPPDSRSGAYGFLVWSVSDEDENQPAAKSHMAVLARMTAPASFNFAITVASCIGHVPGEQDRSERRPKTGRFRLVLHEDRNPVERPAELALGGEELVPSDGFVAGPGVYGHHGLELRTGKVVPLDSRQVPVDELRGGDLTALKRPVERGDRQLGELLVEFRSRRHASVLDHSWLGRHRRA